MFDLGVVVWMVGRGYLVIDLVRVLMSMWWGVVWVFVGLLFDKVRVELW